jgi:hypothetical protein
MNWKLLLVVIGVASFTAGCHSMGFVPGGPALAWSKPDTTRAQSRLDGEECMLEAAENIQPAMGVATTPGFSSPGSLMCNSIGTMTTCNNVGAVNIPPSTYSYDANNPTRQLYVKVCMEKKGYVQVQSHFCQDPSDLTTEDCVVPYRP